MPAKRKTSTGRKTGRLAASSPHPPEALDPTLRLVAALGRYSARELRARQDRLSRAAREMGVQFAVADDQEVSELEWPLDLVPHMLNPAEWAVVSEGLIQRVRAFNCYIEDLYGEQRILRDKIVPYDLVLSDPAFHRPLKGLPRPPGGLYVVIAAADLVRAESGQWLVLENHFSTPFGIAYALQNRRLLVDAFPEIFEDMPVEPVAPFTARMSETLRTHASRHSPHAVLLARGDIRYPQFEESFLARHMGIDMVRPADLLVRGGNVFLRTIRGLERVDVIYRRIESSASDPVAFGESRFSGVPGLVNCVRKGTVSIVNAIGSGVADNKAILRHTDAIISYYLGEEPLLQTVPTYACRDADQAAFVRQHLREMVVKPIHDVNTLRKFYPNLIRAGKHDDMVRLLRERPELVVGQPILKTAHLPMLKGGRLVPREAAMRAFILMGETPWVLPGGLTRHALEPRPQRRITIISGGMKDTWLPAAAGEGAPATDEPLEVPQNQAFSIGSRVAESFYWIGRYLERAENLARQLNILESVRWDQLGNAARLSFSPLWRGVAAATGQPAPTGSSAATPGAALTSRLILNAAEPASVHACVRAACANADSIRDHLTPEFWHALHGLSSRLAETSANPPDDRAGLSEIARSVVDEVARATGTADRTLLHDDAWHFYRIGAFIERALSTLILLECVLKAHRPGAREEADLTALLRLLCSLDAYRREYRSRPYSDRVARLILHNPHNPTSVAYCLGCIISAIRDLARRDHGLHTPLATHAEDILAAIDQLPFQTLFPHPGRKPAPSALAEREQRLRALRRDLETLHQRLEDTYFSHQQPYAAEEQFTLDLL